MMRLKLGTVLNIARDKDQDCFGLSMYARLFQKLQSEHSLKINMQAKNKARQICTLNHRGWERCQNSNKTTTTKSERALS